MIEILTGSILISLLHATIPSHWLPVLAIGRQENWTIKEVSQVTFITALAHASSTVLIGVILGLIGYKISDHIDQITHVATPVILIGMGLVFVYRHYTHKHFHLHGGSVSKDSKRNIIISLFIAMFLSPCLEIEAYFLLAGTISKWLLLSIALIYFVFTITGMIILVRIAYKGLLKFNSHKLEHKAGMITGFILIATGVLSIFID